MMTEHCQWMLVTGVMEGTGESIVIRNVTRYSDDIHECVASNGVPPPAIHQIRVTVECTRLHQTRTYNSSA